MDGGTMGLSLLVAMEDCDAMIILDAAVLDKNAGAVQVFEGQEMDHFYVIAAVAPTTSAWMTLWMVCGCAKRCPIIAPWWASSHTS